MLEVQKKVIEGISYNKTLFKKELIKSFVWLTDDELIELKKWVYKSFYSTHREIIQEVFSKIYEKV